MGLKIEHHIDDDPGTQGYLDARELNLIVYNIDGIIDSVGDKRSSATTDYNDLLIGGIDDLVKSNVYYLEKGKIARVVEYIRKEDRAIELAQDKQILTLIVKDTDLVDEVTYNGSTFEIRVGEAKLTETPVKIGDILIAIIDKSNLKIWTSRIAASDGGVIASNSVILEPNENPPSYRDDGSDLKNGDEYYDLDNNTLKVFNDGIWVNADKNIEIGIDTSNDKNIIAVTDIVENLTDRSIIFFKANNDNDDAVTITIDDLESKELRNITGEQLVAGDILKNNIYLAYWNKDTGYFHCVVIFNNNPSNAFGPIVDVTDDRELNVEYLNDTGRPIAILLRLQAHTSNSSHNIAVNVETEGTVFKISDYSSSNNYLNENYNFSDTIIINKDETYKIVPVDGNPGITYWKEREL